MGQARFLTDPEMGSDAVLGPQEPRGPRMTGRGLVHRAPGPRNCALWDAVCRPRTVRRLKSLGTGLHAEGGLEGRPTAWRAVCSLLAAAVGLMPF